MGTSAGASTASAGDAALGLIDVAVAEVPARLDGIDVEAMRMVLLLHRVTNVLVYDLESTVHRPGGWSWAAFRSLFTLWVSGPLESSRLAELSGMSRQAVSALTKTLEADGLVKREAAAGDGRSVILSLSASGRRRLAAVYRRHNAREAEWAAALEDDERAMLVRLLGKLAAAGQQDWVNHRF
jgi:DNA-binding MarR family transcriptional regulator